MEGHLQPVPDKAMKALERSLEKRDATIYTSGVMAERERCAKICEGDKYLRYDIADAIRNQQ